jgi:UDP-glucose 6-dehydrogenase
MTDVVGSIKAADLVFLCPPTPQGNDHRADLSCMEAVAHQIGPRHAPGAEVEKVASLCAAVDAPVLRMNAASAEALNYDANSFLATELTFVNAIADICELEGTDGVSGLGRDTRIGDQFFNPQQWKSPGFQYRSVGRR